MTNADQLAFSSYTEICLNQCVDAAVRSSVQFDEKSVRVSVQFVQFVGNSVRSSVRCELLQKTSSVSVRLRP